jgi:DMSO reductase family type II enzyme heme b subunit
MKAYRIPASNTELLDPSSAKWKTVPVETVTLAPTPIAALVGEVSPFLAIDSTDHGKIDRVDVGIAHNGEALAIRLSWKCEKHDAIKDLDQFVDGTAVLFPLSAAANAVTMGAKGAPVNAWYWKANHPRDPYDVIAEGFGSSERRSPKVGGSQSAADYADGAWTVVLCRPLSAGRGHVRFIPGKPSRIAMAVWDGGNLERSGRKSFSGEFVTLDIEK